MPDQVARTVGRDQAGICERDSFPFSNLVSLIYACFAYLWRGGRRLEAYSFSHILPEQF